MKSTIKLVAAIPVLTICLATPSWAAPRSKVSHNCPKAGREIIHYGSGGAHVGPLWFLQTGPRSKL